jgi:hypothetical protein
MECNCVRFYDGSPHHKNCPIYVMSLQPKFPGDDDHAFVCVRCGEVMCAGASTTIPRDAANALRAGIYEFRKRANRAVQS